MQSTPCHFHTFSEKVPFLKISANDLGYSRFDLIEARKSADWPAICFQIIVIIIRMDQLIHMRKEKQ